MIISMLYFYYRFVLFYVDLEIIIKEHYNIYQEGDLQSYSLYD